MKMKKLFVGVLSVLLVLSMAGMVSGLERVQTVDNKSVIESGNNGWTSESVNITLSLDNDFTVTIPHDFTLVRSTVSGTDGTSTGVVTYSTHDSSANVKPITVSADVVLLEHDQAVNITIGTAAAKYYNETYTYSYYQNGLQSGQGAWKLVGTDSNHNDVDLHYLISVDGGHLQPRSDYLNNKLTVQVGDGSTLVKSGDSILKATKGTNTATLHMMVVDEPSVVTTYKSELTFVVKVDNYDYGS